MGVIGCTRYLPRARAKSRRRASEAQQTARGCGCFWGDWRPRLASGPHYRRTKARVARRSNAGATVRLFRVSVFLASAKSPPDAKAEYIVPCTTPLLRPPHRPVSSGELQRGLGGAIAPEVSRTGMPNRGTPCSSATKVPRRFHPSKPAHWFSLARPPRWPSVFVPSQNHPPPPRAPPLPDFQKISPSPTAFPSLLLDILILTSTTTIASSQHPSPPYTLIILDLLVN